MTLNLDLPHQDELKPRITVFGVGGAGGNAVNNMIAQQLEGVEFVVANTDAQALAQSLAPAKVQMGVKVTEGLGAGARAAVGAAAAEESIEDIIDHLAGAHMCFITAGMGGGTGTGATPIIAQAARELGVLTVGVVTKPFQFEGAKRMRQAEEGVEALQKMVDTLIIIPNQNLFRLANEKTTCTDAFAMADDVLYQGVKGVTDLMVRPGLINLDFADVRAVMDEMGKAMMGTGEAEGDDRALQAAEKAIANPLLDEISLNGAKGVLINITGGHDLTLFELDEAANVIREKVDPDANIIVGSTLDETMSGKVRVSVVATGIDASVQVGDVPVPRRRMAEPLVTPRVEEPAAAPAPAPARLAAASSRPTAAQVVAARRAAPAERAERAEPAAPDQDFFADYTPVHDTADQDEGSQTAAEDDMPAPAYRPAAAAPQAPANPVSQAVAARRGAPGQPTPEALARLQAVVGKANASGARQPQGQQPPVERPRFGINSLINRMTGHQEGEHQRPTPSQSQPARRAQPQVHRFEDEEDVSEQDRIEIPAFLRRQAN
ncbi:cell division protein FtsZ [Oceaniovalibus guishaninsula JLT2003]|uniref:Cell division protein FtsZ n=1 Tax=Oceaniovalibus guishaninsula JLT2003 TaxID=1231392 RepID=K2GRT1_9RHOB|nr:cell division protein FtsZ [Oceaniovalibus guishaninsula]EKE45351.1 cell division protein FtsZ [Oceaniovalibus guishaninsula JLT2003]